MSAQPPDHPKRKKPQSTVRGGFLVHRRGDSTGKIRTAPGYMMFEHASLEEARTEAERLAGKYKREFAVFQEVAAVLPPASEQGKAA